MMCRDVLLTCSLAALVGCSAVGGPPINVGAGGSAQGGASSDSLGSSGGTTANGAGGSSRILDIAGTIATGSGAGGAGGEDTAGTPPSAEENCGKHTENTKHEVVDILVVLDRSGSMSLNIANDCYCDQETRREGVAGRYSLCSDLVGCKNRWTSVSAGIETIVAATPDIQWGLKLYSTPGQDDTCGVSSEIENPIGSIASAIRDTIDKASPGNHTPTAAGITTAAKYLNELKDDNTKVILLATDGEPKCADGGKRPDTEDSKGTKAAIEAALAMGIKTYVIGIGPSTGNLDNFAEAGGTGKHFPATSPEALNEALSTIGTAVVSCTFTLDNSNPETGVVDPNNVAVYVDKNLVEKGDTDGWSFGENDKTIVLNGAICEQVKTARKSTVEVLLGCKVPPRWIP